MANPLDPWKADIQTASKKYGVPAALLAAQLYRESGFRPDAKSPAGATGIAQFMPATAKGMGLDPTDPHASIDAQGKMMGRLLKSYKGDQSLALAAYNAGSGAVAKYGGKVPPYKETQDYVKNILADVSGGRFPGLAAQDAGKTLPLPDGAPSTVPSIPGKPRETASQSLQAPAQQAGPFQGAPTAGGFLGAALQTLGITGGSSLQKVEPKQQMLPLPGGTASTVPVNKVVVDKKAADNTPISPDGLGIVAAAEKFEGTPYSWGGGGVKGPTKGVEQGANTTGFDCSGLLQYSVAKATGKVIPRVASAQYAAATKVKPEEMKPGDGVWFGSKNDIHHVGIYIGNGKFIQAPKTGDVVKISNLKDRSDFVGAGRFTD